MRRRVHALRHRYRFDTRWKRWLAVGASLLGLLLVLLIFAYLLVALTLGGGAIMRGGMTYVYDPLLEYPVFRVPWWFTVAVAVLCAAALVVLTHVSRGNLDWYRAAALQPILSTAAAALPPVYAILYPVEWGLIPYPWIPDMFFGAEIWAMVTGFAAVAIVMRMEAQAFQKGHVPPHQEWEADRMRALTKAPRSS